nr:hypothetical protein [Tanacetum cinerariifolium]
MLAICTADGLKEFQAPKSTFQTRESSNEGSTPRAKLVKIKSFMCIVFTLRLDWKNHSLGISQKRLLRLKKAFLRRGKSPHQPRTRTLTSLSLPQMWLLKRIKRPCKQPVAKFIKGSLVKKRATPTKVDLGKSDPNDYMSLKQDQTKSTREGLETAYTKTKPEPQPKFELETNAEHVVESETEVNAPISSHDKKINMDDLSKLVQKTAASFMEWESPEDEQLINVSNKDEADMAKETEDTLIKKSPPSSPQTIQIRDQAKKG